MNRYAPAPASPIRKPLVCTACLEKDARIAELEDQLVKISDAYATQHQEVTALATAYRKLLDQQKQSVPVPAPAPVAPVVPASSDANPKKRKRSDTPATTTTTTTKKIKGGGKKNADAGTDAAAAAGNTEARRSAIRLVKWIPDAAKLPEDPALYTPKDMATKAANDRGYYMLIGALLTEVFNHFKKDKGGEGLHDHNTNLIKDKVLFKLLARVLRQGSNPDDKTKNTLSQNYYLKSLLEEYSHGIREIVEAREDGIFTIECIRYIWKYTWDLISKGITQRVTDNGGPVPDVCLAYPVGSVITQLEFIQVILYPNFATLVPGWIHSSSVIKFKCSVRHEFQQRVTEAYNLWYSAWTSKNKNMISKIIRSISPVAESTKPATTKPSAPAPVVDTIHHKDNDVVPDDQSEHASNQDSSSSSSDSNESPDRASNLSSSSSSSDDDNSDDDDEDVVVQAPPTKRRRVPATPTGGDYVCPGSPKHPGSPKYVPVNKDEMASDNDQDDDEN